MPAADSPDGAKPGPPAGGGALATGRGLSRRQRILSSSVFRKVFETGTSYAGRFLVLWLGRDPDADPRLGVVAGKRSIPRAVDRARAKRLLREAFRLNRFRFQGDRCVVLLARRKILSVDRAQVEQDLLALAGRARILRDGHA